MPIDLENQKSVIVDGVTYKYSADWIYSLETEIHWRLYWRQQKLMENLVLPGHTVLEIGVGSGFTANYLRSKNVSVTTLDIDEDKAPDIVANIVEYDFQIKYDHLAFEVFEHIPFDKFKEVLHRLANVARRYLFMSVPQNDRILVDFSLKLPKIKQVRFNITVPRRQITTPHHCWEVNCPPIKKATMENALSNAGFEICRQDKAFSRLFLALQPIASVTVAQPGARCFLGREN